MRLIPKRWSPRAFLLVLLGIFLVAGLIISFIASSKARKIQADTTNISSFYDANLKWSLVVDDNATTFSSGETHPYKISIKNISTEDAYFNSDPGYYWFKLSWPGDLSQDVPVPDRGLLEVRRGQTVEIGTADLTIPAYTGDYWPTKVQFLFNGSGFGDWGDHLYFEVPVADVDISPTALASADPTSKTAFYEGVKATLTRIAPNEIIPDPDTPQRIQYRIALEAQKTFLEPERYDYKVQFDGVQGGWSDTTASHTFTFSPTVSTANQTSDKTVRWDGTSPSVKMRIVPAPHPVTGEGPLRWDEASPWTEIPVRDFQPPVEQRPSYTLQVLDTNDQPLSSIGREPTNLKVRVTSTLPQPASQARTDYFFIQFDNLDPSLAALENLIDYPIGLYTNPRPEELNSLHFAVNEREKSLTRDFTGIKAASNASEIKIRVYPYLRATSRLSATYRPDRRTGRGLTEWVSIPVSAVQPPVEPPPQDTDDDGVLNDNDLCAGTPANTPVNSVGCPDTDGDGVFDNEDQCPAEAGPASNNGCPETQQPQLVNLTGRVLEDTNNNGEKDEADQPLSGATVKLIHHIGGAEDVARTVTTGADGRFTLSQIGLGVYRVEETNPSGYISVKESNPQDTEGVSDTNINNDKIVIRVGATPPEIYFLERRAPLPQPVLLITNEDVNLAKHGDTINYTIQLSNTGTAEIPAGATLRVTAYNGLTELRQLSVPGVVRVPEAGFNERGQDEVPLPAVAPGQTISGQFSGKINPSSEVTGPVLVVAQFLQTSGDQTMVLGDAFVLVSIRQYDEVTLNPGFNLFSLPYRVTGRRDELFVNPMPMWKVVPGGANQTGDYEFIDPEDQVAHGEGYIIYNDSTENRPLYFKTYDQPRFEEPFRIDIPRRQYVIIPNPYNRSVPVVTVAVRCDRNDDGDFSNEAPCTLAEALGIETRFQADEDPELETFKVLNPYVLDQTGRQFVSFTLDPENPQIIPPGGGLLIVSFKEGYNFQFNLPPPTPPEVPVSPPSEAGVPQPETPQP